MNYELKNLYSRALMLKSSNELTKKNIAENEKMLGDNSARKEELEELQTIVQEAARRTQDKIKSRFETMVQSCLDTVFPGMYKFHFDFVPKRGKVETDIYLTDDNDKRFNPMESNGGGVVDVISIALRVACLTMSGKEKILLLDEPFSHLRGTARSRLGEVLECLSSKVGLQIIMVGDVGGSSVKANREFNVTKNKGVSSVKEVDLSDR